MAQGQVRDQSSTKARYTFSPEIISPAAHLKSAFRFLSVAMSVPSL